MRIVVGITGASGVILGYEMVKALRNIQDCEIHLIVSEGAKITWKSECEIPLERLTDLADYIYDEKDMSAYISSGSFKTDGMIILPCSMKTLSAIAHGYADNLIVRAADVCIKEGRKLILAPREMPLSNLHIKNMLEVSNMGCVLVPPMLTFYNNPKSINDEIDHIIGKILMQFGISYERFVPWEGGKFDKPRV